MSRRPIFRHPRYRLRRLLGKGGTSRVYLATDRGALNREVALKLYTGRTAAERIRREFEILTTLRHPHIARALDYGRNEAGGAPFLTMEFARGEPLDRWWDRQQTPAAGRLASLLAVFHDVAAALGSLHRRGLLHLDVKPKNILIVEPGEGLAAFPLLIDFGLARRYGPEVKEPLAEGTAAYAAPELFRGEAPGPPYDVYSLGVTFYRILAGRHPFAPPYPEAHLRAAARPPGGLPEPLQALLLRALAKDPQLRYADGDALADAVRTVLHDCGSVAESGPSLIAQNFAGRAAEIRRFTAWLAGSGPRPAVFVAAGPPGIGKSRLLERFDALLAAMERPRVRVTWSSDFASSLSFLLESLGRLVPRKAPPSVAEKLLAAWHKRRRSARLAGFFSAPARRETLARILDHVARRLMEAHAAGLFVLIDEAGGDPHALGELLALACAAAADPELPSEPRGGTVGALGPAALDRFERRLGEFSAPQPERIELGPLSRSEAEAFEPVGLRGAALRASARRWRELLDEAYERSAGNPHLLVREIACTAYAGFRPLRDDWRTRLEAEVNALARDLCETLAAVCSAQASPTLETLASALGRPLEEVERSCRALVHLGLLSGGEDGYRPAYAELKGLAACAIERPDAAAVHRRFAESFAKRSETLHAAVRHYLEAGERDLAAASAERLLDELRLFPVMDPRQADVLREAAEAVGVETERGRRLLEGAADLLETLGRFRECADLRRRLLEIPCGDAFVATRKLACALHRAGEIDEALALLETLCAEPELKRRPDEALLVFTERALLHHFRNEPELALKFAGEALHAIRRVPARKREGLRDNLLHVHAIIGQILIRRFEPAEAVKHLRRAVGLARRGPPRGGFALLLNNLGLALALAGRLDGARHVLERGLEKARQVHDGAATVSILCNLAQTEAKGGDFDKAEALWLEAAKIAAVRQSKRLALGHRYTEALLAALAGRPEPGKWLEVEKAASETGDAFLATCARLYRSEALVETGDIEEAERLLEMVEKGGTLAAAARVRRAFTRALRGFEETSRELRRTPPQGGADKASAMLRDWTSLWAARAALLTGDLAEARTAAQLALKGFRAQGIQPGETEAALLLAEVELCAGRLGTAARRLSFLESRAGATFRGRPARDLPLRLGLLKSHGVLLRRLRAWGRVRRSRSRDESEKPHPASDRGPTRAGSPDVWDGALDLDAGESLRHVAAAPALAEEPLLRLRFEALSAAHALLEGRFEDARRHGVQARLVLRRLRGKAPPYSGPWRMLGLEALLPPCGRIRAEPSARDRFERVAAEVVRSEPSPVEALRALLEALRDALALEAAAVHCEGGGPSLRTGSKARGPGARAVLPLRAFGRAVAHLVVAFPEGRIPSGRDVALLRVALPYLALLAAQATAPRRRAEEPVEPSDASETAPLAEETAPVTRPLLRESREGGIVAASRAMRRVLAVVERLRTSELPVLITGESGVGKDLIARTIHDTSSRAGGPYVAQNAAALSPELLEADLFGYAQGAFSGAERTHTGFLFRAQGGTFHLEEVGDLAPEAQAKLLRLLEEGAVRPVGASTPRSVDVRFIASTHRDIERMVEEGTFRRDLYHRLSGVRIHIPPLRQRPDDIPPLIERYSKEVPEGPVRLTREAVEALLEYPWPGNVRELIMFLRRLGLEYGRRPVSRAAVSALLTPAEPEGLFPRGLFISHSYEELLRRLEESYLAHLLERHGGDVEAMARELGTSPRSVYRRFERLGLKPQELYSRLQRSGHEGR